MKRSHFWPATLLGTIALFLAGVLIGANVVLWFDGGGMPWGGLLGSALLLFHAFESARIPLHVGTYFASQAGIWWRVQPIDDKAQRAGAKMSDTLVPVMMEVLELKDRA